MSGTLDGRVAIVTGASRGLGKATAKAFAREGASVVVTGRSRGGEDGTVESTVEEIRSLGAQAIASISDVRNSDDVEKVVSITLDTYGRLDVLVNNAGIFGPYVPTSELDIERFDNTMSTNVRGVFLFSRAATPALRVRGGSIINLSSLMASHDASPAADIAYAASKAAADRITTYMADELKQYDVAVNGLIPQGLKTEGAVVSLGEDFDWSEHEAPEEIVPPMLFLAQQRGNFTGHIVYRDEIVDGQYLKKNRAGAVGAGPSTIEVFRDEVR